MSETVSPGPVPIAPSGKPGRGRWLLIASLAFNLLVAGALAGAFFFGPKHGPGRWGATPMEFGLMHFSRKLPEDRRVAVREVLREGRKTAKPLRAQLRDARLTAANVLGSADYSADRMQAALAQIGVIEDGLRRNGVSVVVTALDKLTPEDRKALSEIWTKRLERHDKRRKGRTPEKDGKDADDDAATDAAP